MSVDYSDTFCRILPIYQFFPFNSLPINANSSVGYAAGVQGELAAYRDSTTNNLTTIFSANGGRTWGAPTNTGISLKPNDPYHYYNSGATVAYFDPSFYIAYFCNGTGNVCVTSTMDGVSFTTPIAIQGFSTAGPTPSSSTSAYEAPSIINFASHLVIAACVPIDDNYDARASLATPSDGKNFALSSQVPTLSCGTDPRMAGLGNNLYLAFAGESNSLAYSQLVYTTSAMTSFTVLGPISTTEFRGDPFVFAGGAGADILYVGGRSSNNEFVYTGSQTYGVSFEPAITYTLSTPAVLSPFAVFQSGIGVFLTARSSKNGSGESYETH